MNEEAPTSQLSPAPTTPLSPGICATLLIFHSKANLVVPTSLEIRLDFHGLTSPFVRLR